MKTTFTSAAAAAIAVSSALLTQAAPTTEHPLAGQLRAHLASSSGTHSSSSSSSSSSTGATSSFFVASSNNNDNRNSGHQALATNAGPISLRFGSTQRHQQFHKLKDSLGGLVEGGAEAKNNLIKKRQASTNNGTSDDNESELLNFDDTRYIASINIAGQNLDVILDTGSTDTFVYSVQPTPFQGFDPAELPPLFNNDTAVGLVDTGLTYEARYGSGNGITETLGAIQLADVSLEGTDFAVNNLTFANLYESSAATGASGLLGLGFPINGIIWLTILDQVYNTTGRVLTRNESEAYFPIVPLLEVEGYIPQAIFSVEVDRDPISANAGPQTSLDFNYTDGGTLTLGGYPEGMAESDFTWSPVPVVEFTQNGQSRGLPASTGNRWTTPLEAIYFNGVKLRNTTEQSDVRADGGNYYMLIDTGNPSFSMPRDVMSQITNAWAANPNNYYVPCDSAFDLQLQFGGRNFTMSRTDFLVPSYNALDSLNYGGFTTQGCQLQAQVSEPTPDELGPQTSITYTAGAPLLRNVISVFDYGSIWNAVENPPRIGLAPRTQ